MGDYGDIVVRDNGVEVLEGPERALISLSMVASADPRHVKVTGCRILLGTSRSVEYVVVGWDPQSMALIVERSTPSDGPLRCDNCGKAMAEHDALAHCWPTHRDGCQDEGTPL